ncbi:MAG TPA: hypothetical protein VMW93_01815 [bacterium]|nr:hypothetical protein [bacterium]
MKLRGTGLIIDTGRGVGFPDYGDLEVDFGLNVLNLAPPSPGGGCVAPYDAPLTGRIAWYELTADLLAAVTGDALFGGAMVRAEAEPHLVPDEPPYAIELAEPANVPLSEVVVGDDNLRLGRVAGSPGPDEYAADGGRLTFGAGRAGEYVYVDYFYVDESSGRTLVLNPFTAAGEFKLLATLKLSEAEGNLYERELMLAAERCRRTGPLAAGPADGDFGSFGFEFAVENRAAGDVTLYFP